MSDIRSRVYSITIWCMPDREPKVLYIWHCHAISYISLKIMCTLDFLMKRSINPWLCLVYCLTPTEKLLSEERLRYICNGVCHKLILIHMSPLIIHWPLSTPSCRENLSWKLNRFANKCVPLTIGNWTNYGIKNWWCTLEQRSKRHSILYVFINLCFSLL